MLFFDGEPSKVTELEMCFCVVASYCKRALRHVGMDVLPVEPAFTIDKEGGHGVHFAHRARRSNG